MEKEKLRTLDRASLLNPLKLAQNRAKDIARLDQTCSCRRGTRKDGPDKVSDKRFGLHIT